MLDRYRVTPEGFVWLLGAACQLHRLPFDPASLLKQFPLPHTTDVLHTALGKFGFRSAIAAVDATVLPHLTFPCFALVPAPHHDSSGAESDPADFVLLLKADGDRVVYLAPDDSQPREKSATHFLAGCLGVVLQFGRAEKMPAEEAKDAVKTRFGLHWFASELLKHQAVWRTVLLASLVIHLVALAAPLVSLEIIDNVLPHQTRGSLVVLACSLAFVIVFTAVVSWLRQYLVLHTGNRIDAVLGNQVLRHLLRLPLSFFDTRSSGNVLSRLQGIETVREFFAGGALTLMFDLPFLPIFLVAMFWLSWQLTLVSLVLIGAVVVVSILATPLLRDHLKRQLLLGARNQSFLAEQMAGMATLKTLQMEAYVEKRYSDYLTSYLTAGFGSRQAVNSYTIVANALEQTMMLATFVAGAAMVMRNDGFTIGMLVAFQLFAYRIGQPMLRLVTLWQEFQKAVLAVERLGEILDQETETQKASSTAERANASRVELVGVAFRHAEDQPWLYRHLDLSFQAGHLTVLRGPSGCGKSTLADLLQGFYQPLHGRIYLDGCDTRQMATNELRAAFGVVPQEITLFSGTLYDNLIMAQPHASFEEVLRACKAADIHDTIDKLPDGYRTEISERGANLSCAQRRGLGLARALLRRPSVLILDQTLSNLDNASAERLARGINRLRGKMTVIYLAHQIPPALHVDEVLTIGRSPANDEFVGSDRRVVNA